MPLSYLHKRSALGDQRMLRNFDLVDESGRSLSLLGSSDNAQAAWSALVLAARVFGEVPEEVSLTEEELQILWHVAVQPSSIAEHIYAALTAEPWPTQIEAGPLVLSMDGTESLREAIRDPLFRHLVGRFSTDYLLMTELTERETERRVLKFSYEMQLDPEGGYFWGRLGLQPVGFSFTYSGVLPCRSLHFEVQVPDHLEAMRATLVAQLRLDDRLKTRQVSDNQVRKNRSFPHVHVGAIRIGEGVAALVSLRTRREARSWVAFSMSILLAAWFAVGCVYPKVVLTSPDSGRSLLLLIPGLVVGAMLLRQEHQLVTRLLFGEHVVAFGLILLAVLGAVSVMAIGAVSAADDQARHVEEAWRFLLGAAGLLTMLSIPSLWRKG